MRHVPVGAFEASPAGKPSIEDLRASTSRHIHNRQLNLTGSSLVPTRQFTSSYHFKLSSLGKECTMKLLCLCVQESKRAREGFSARPHISSMLLSIHSSNRMYIQLCFQTYQRSVVRSNNHHYQPCEASRAHTQAPSSLCFSLINIMKKPTKTPPAKCLVTTKDGLVPCIYSK